MSTHILDNLEQIKKLDSKNMLGSLELLSAQVEQIVQAAKKVVVPSSYSKAKHLVVVGMGGSTLGSHIVKALYFNELKIQIDIVNGYHIPGFVGRDTLVLLSSYSGNTEEVLAAMKEAKSKKAKLLVIASGGTLAEFSKQQKIPSLIFSAENNPCNSPRMGLGYSIFGQIALLCKCGILRCTPQKMKEAIEAIKKYNIMYGAESKTENNQAKKFAVEAQDRCILFAASEHLSGNAHVAANQMNENAKRFSAYFILPELNHHLLEGMAYPRTNQSRLLFVLMESVHYDLRVQKRYEITKKVLDKNNIKHLTYKCQEKERLMQMCEMLVFSGYLSFYSAMVEGIDPTAIPYVDFLKSELKK